MFSSASRANRAISAALAGLLLTAGLVGIAEVTPASAAIVDDQPLSAVASSMWQTNNTVWALDVAGGVVYTGGDFTSVRPPGNAAGTGEVVRNHIAAFNASTGALITTFDPNINGAVTDLDVSNDGTKLYVTGSFSTVGTTARQNLARLNLPSGSLDTGWVANASSNVMTVASDNTAVYVAGDFTTIKGVARTRIAKLNTTNGNVVTAFDASSDKRITESAIAPDGSRVIVGGENDVINGQPQAAVASLDPTTGALMPWLSTGVAPRATNGGCDTAVTDIIVDGSLAYVTADGLVAGCWEGYYAANISDGSLVYNQHCLGASVGLAIANGWMYRGSHNHDCSKNPGGYVGPNNVNDFVWHRLQAHRLSDGRLGHWTPGTNGGSPGTSTSVGPQVITTDGTNIYVGGDFSTVNQQSQQGLTRFTASGGNSAPVTPTTAPRVTPTAAGTLSINVEGTSDNNDGELTYNLFRDGGNTPVATAAAESWPWSLPVVRFTDSGLTAGDSHTYQVTATDGSLTSARSPASLPVRVGWANPPDYPTAVGTVGAATHWRLNDSASPVADNTGNGRTGDIVGGVTTGQPGAVLDNSAITTNGSTGYVTSTSSIAPTAAFTQSVWFKTTTDRGGAIMGFTNAKTGVGTLDNRAIWMDNDGKVGFGIRRGSTFNPGMSFVRSPGTYNDGLWHQSTAVFNGTNAITLYMDGMPVATLAVTQVILPGAGFLRAGYLNLANFYTVFSQNFDGAPAVMSYFWEGSIDEVTMHNAALNGDQIAALYASGSAHGAPLPPEQPDPGPPPPPPLPSTYPPAVLADAPSLYWRLNELNQTTVADASGNNRTGTFRNGLSYGVAGALTDNTTAVLSPGASGVAYSNTQQAAPTTYSIETWVKTTSTTGGKILGYENAQTGWGDSYDRQIYMTNNGRIAYGIVSGAVQQTITSTAFFNDGEWHHVAATQGAGGMKLYVDWVLIGTNATVTPDAYSGYWRLGGGNVTGWPNAPSSSALAGTFDETAVYPIELTAAQVAAHDDPLIVIPTAPTNVHTTTVTSTSVGLAWDAPAGTITGYRVFRDNVLVGSPAGTTFTDNGVVANGTYSYTVTAVNDSDLESPPSTALLVGTPNQLPTISASPNPATAQAGETTLVDVVTSDPDGDGVTTSITAGPAFATLVGGDLQLTPGPGDVAGSPFTVTVEVSDGLDTATVNVTVNVTPPANQPPTISASPSPITVTAGQTGVVDLTTSDPDGDPVTISILSGPPFATLVGGDLQLSPPLGAQTGSPYTVELEATAGAHTVGTEVTVNVVAPVTNQVPTITASPNPITVTAGQTGVVDLTTGDGDGDPLTTSITSGPAFATLVGGDLSLSPGAGDVAGSPYTVTVQVSDGEDTASVNVTVNVTAPPDPPAGGTFGDFDGDGDTDFAVFRPSNGRWYISGVAGSTLWGQNGDKAVPADYDGDGDTDFAVWRPSNGRWYVNGVAGSTQHGQNGDVPVPGDYDGNGTIDFAVFRPSNGRWYISGVAGSTQWGQNGDQAAPGDYNGDGDTELAVFRPSNGRWYIQGVAGSTAWGANGDKAVQADYDGDGDTDIAVFRPSNGRWYINGVAGSTQHGASGDVAVPADYDGDGTIDLAVWRPGNGRWYVQGIAGSTQHGANGDVPAPRPTGTT